MRRYERASTILTSNRPWTTGANCSAITAVVTALLDRLLHHAHVLKCGPKSWRQKSTRTCDGGHLEVELTSLGRRKIVGFACPEIVGFEPSTEDRSSLGGACSAAARILRDR